MLCITKWNSHELMACLHFVMHSCHELTTCLHNCYAFSAWAHGMFAFCYETFIAWHYGCFITVMHSCHELMACLHNSYAFMSWAHTLFAFCYETIHSVTLWLFNILLCIHSVTLWLFHNSYETFIAWHMNGCFKICYAFMCWHYGCFITVMHSVRELMAVSFCYA